MLQVLQSTRGGDATLGRLLGRFGVPAVVGTALLLIAIFAGSLWAAEWSASALQAGQVLRRQRLALTNILVEVQGAESAQRGFLLTEDPAYLPPLQHALDALPALLSRLGQARPDSPAFIGLKQVLTAKLAELEQTVKLDQAGDRADAMAIVRTNVGNENMTQLRRLTSDIQAELDISLLHQLQMVDNDNRMVILVDGAGLIAIFLLGWQTARAVRSYLASLAEAQNTARRAYGELERSNERLDDMVRVRTADLMAANDEIQRFAYIVSHDLRAPLVNIMGFTSEMEQASIVVARHVLSDSAPAELTQAAAEDIPEALRFIRSSTSKMDRLINAILKLSREGRRVLTPEPVDMAALFSGIIESLQHQAASRGATIAVGDVPTITADRLALEQVFSNLVDNALKYLRPDVPGEIKISGSRVGSSVTYQIADNGRGIADRDRERVFELFRRAGDQTVPGEGIGLAHVRALVRRLGGTIDCSSALGAGTTFTLRLPAVANHAREIAA